MPIIDELITILGFDADTKEGEKFKGTLSGIKIAAIAAGTAIIGAAGAVGIFTNQTAQALAETGRFSESVGVPADRLQELEFAAKQVGGSMADLRGDLKGITQALASPIPGEFNQGLFLLGINVRDAAGQLKSADQILLEVSDRFDGLSAQQRQILSTQVGLSESTLRLVAQGRAEIEKSAAVARELGAVVKPGDIKAAIEYERRLGQVKAVFSGIAKTLSISLLPGINDFLKGSLEWFQANRLIIAQNLESVVRGIASGIRFLAEKANELGSFLSSKLGINFEDLTGKIGLAEIAFNATVAAVGALLVAFSPLIAKFALIAAAATGVYLVIEDLIVAFRGGKSVSGEMFNDLLEKFPEVRQAFEDIKTFVVNLFQSFAESEEIARFVEFMKSATSSVTETLGILAQAFLTAFTSIASALAGWSSDTDSAVETFFSLISPITSFLETQINLWLGIFRAFALFLSGDIPAAVDTLITTFANLGESVLNAGNKVVDLIAEILPAIGDSVAEIGSGLGQSMADLVSIVAQSTGEIAEMIEQFIVDTFTGLIDRAIAAVKESATAAKESLGELITSIPGVSLLTGGEEQEAEPGFASPSKLLARNRAMAAMVPTQIAGGVTNNRTGGNIAQNNVFNISGAGSPELVASRVASAQAGTLSQALQVAGVGAVE